MKKIGKQTIKLENQPSIISSGAIVGKKEHEGPLSKEFTNYITDSFFGEKSFEKAESRLQKTAVKLALEKASLKPSQIDNIFAGDLLNQCIGSAFSIRDLGISFIGLYGACSTMALSTALASIFVESGISNNAVAVTSSHFCSAERQYRFPLNYGSQRTPTAQWTVTGSGALVLAQAKDKPYIEHITFGKIKDLNITDTNNMGAAMAPDDVKIRPYQKGVGIWNSDLFSGVIFAVAMLKMLEMPKAFLRFLPCHNKNNFSLKKPRHIPNAATHEGMVFFYTQIQYLRGVKL